jgi:peroxiredoxin
MVLAAGLGILAACKGSTGPDETGTATFKGRITREGAPLIGTTVSVIGDASRSTVTNDDGTFSIKVTSGETFLLAPWRKDFSFAPAGYFLGLTSRSDLNFTATTGPYGAEVGTTAADFAALDQNGHFVSLYADLGSVVLIEFSADWCGSCRAEAAKLEALYQTYKDRGFQVLTVLVDGSAAAWASEFGLTTPVVEDTTRSLWSLYGGGWLPVNIVLDRTMVIRYKEIDYDEAAIVSVISGCLEGLLTDR